jgi:hypothetical protein
LWVRGDLDDLEGKVLPALVIFQHCQSRSALPESGGILDQEVEWLSDFALIESVIADETKRRERRRRGKKP